MTKIRHDSAASEDLIGSGKEFASGVQADRDSVETAGRQIANALGGGAGSDETQALHKQAYQRAEELNDASGKTISTDQKTQDINASAMPRMQSFFGNRA